LLLLLGLLCSCAMPVTPDIAQEMPLDTTLSISAPPNNGGAEIRQSKADMPTAPINLMSNVNATFQDQFFSNNEVLIETFPASVNGANNAVASRLFSENGTEIYIKSASNLVVYENKVYFCALQRLSAEEDTTHMYQCNLDGTEVTELIAENVSRFYIYNDKIYYLRLKEPVGWKGEEATIYECNLDGSDSKLLYKSPAFQWDYYFGIHYGDIIFATAERMIYFVNLETLETHEIDLGENARIWNVTTAHEKIYIRSSIVTGTDRFAPVVYSLEAPHYEPMVALDASPSALLSDGMFLYYFESDKDREYGQIVYRYNPLSEQTEIVARTSVMASSPSIAGGNIYLNESPHAAMRMFKIDLTTGETTRLAEVILTDENTVQF
jgi:hypothetical protein